MGTFTAKEKKKFRERHICVVNPYKRAVYDFSKKRQVRMASPFNNRGNRESMPHIGYMCEHCNTANTVDKLYLVNGQSVHEQCGLKIIY